MISLIKCSGLLFNTLEYRNKCVNRSTKKEKRASSLVENKTNYHQLLTISFQKYLLHVLVCCYNFRFCKILLNRRLLSSESGDLSFSVKSADFNVIRGFCRFHGFCGFWEFCVCEIGGFR